MAIFNRGLPRTTDNPSHMLRRVGKLRKEQTGAPIELLVPHQTTVKVVPTTSVGTPSLEAEPKAAAVTTTTTTTTATTGKRKDHPHPMMQIPPTVPQTTKKTTNPSRPENPAAKPTHPEPHRPRPQKPEAEASNNNPIRHHQRTTAPPPPLPYPP